ncbi:hypothetical protein EPA93_24280 [Ktedonosporobacter rubrisoli]|uniref:Uncharacterized protein n=1 Tax=Ktedonosporobacter rubrisoli TaxID=2509675 RepID=A0A4V0YZ94_KTERU|nr:hypothetical protein [Ktedonosporobacter rubrisoli]QBD78931.1 hypothetical protein EPA93_24280 [Ktedonosporobacter rubrisoli]
MPKQNFTLGTSSVFDSQAQTDRPIKLFLTVYDVAPQDWIDQTHPRTGVLLPRPMTIGEYKQLWNNQLQGSLSHPLAKGENFLFDLSPWANLPDDTYLMMEWTFEVIHPSSSEK